MNSKNDSLEVGVALPQPCSPATAAKIKAAHDKAWEQNFVVPIGREMKRRGIAYMVMIIRDDGKVAYVLDTEIPENSQISHS